MHKINLKIGQKYRDFEVTRLNEIKELQSVLIELVHLPTGAQVMHIANDDPENLFCLSFQTLPSSSNGVAHILEHTVLCGSEKFPIKDPFFSMSRRSLNTFMNALTGADFTCYPAATQNAQDFYNLLDVYTDAVFHPKLDILSFRQEGHRLEFEIPTNPNSSLEYKGIVFNEMKGALAPPDARLGELMNQALFPSITYGHNSGGDPKIIPILSYQELIDFHKTNYHPSRCLFFFYGNFPLENHPDFIEKNALKGVQKLPPLNKPLKQPRFTEKKIVEAYYPASKDEQTNNKTIISFGWLTCDISKQEELLALSVIEIILMETDASLLKFALMNSGLCKQVTCFIETDYTEIPLIITLKGCNSESSDKLEQIIKETLIQIIQEGIPEELIENALHRLEFYRSEITGDHTPFGLNLFFRSGLIKQHGQDPELGLMIHSLFKKSREDIKKNPLYLTNLIKKHLVENPHFVRITMIPDADLSSKEIAEEKQILEKIQSKLNDKQINEIIEQANDLKIFQKEQELEDLTVLPKILLSDVDKNCRNFDLKNEHFQNLTVYHHGCFTNEIVYADLVFPLPFIEEKDLSLLRLFTFLLTQMGSGGRNYLENLKRMQAKTGGISAPLSINPQASDCDTFTPSLHIHGKALHRYAKDLFELIKDTITSVDFTDKKRLKEAILKHYTSLESSFNQTGLKYAINLSASSVNLTSMIINQWYGLNYYENLKTIVADIDNNVEKLCTQLQKMQDSVLCLYRPELIISSDKIIYELLKSNDFFGLQNLKMKSYTPWKSEYLIPKTPSQGRVISSPVAFIGKVFKTVSYIHEDAPALNISSFLFDNLVLHQKIREQGGAYGGGAVCNTITGTYYFYSYRDPNIASGLQAFLDSIYEIVSCNFDEEDLEEAKLEIIQGMDAPVSPGNRGYLAYCWMREGKTAEVRQKFRDKILSLTIEDVIDAVKKHIQIQVETGTTVVFAGKELLEKENAILALSGKPELEIYAGST